MWGALMALVMRRCGFRPRRSILRAIRASVPEIGLLHHTSPWGCSYQRVGARPRPHAPCYELSSSAIRNRYWVTGRFNRIRILRFGQPVLFHPMISSWSCPLIPLNRPMPPVTAIGPDSGCGPSATMPEPSSGR